MIYALYYSDGGTPKTGLSPTIDIYIKLSDGSSAGSAPTISELSGGYYKFTATPSERILCRIDSEDVNMSDNDRYIPTEIGPNDDTFDSIDEAIVGANPTTLKGKTQSIWNRLFTNRSTTEALETAYEKDDATIMETWNLSDDNITGKRER